MAARGENDLPTEMNEPSAPENLRVRSPDDYAREVAANDAATGLCGCLGCIAPTLVLSAAICFTLRRN